MEKCTINPACLQWFEGRCTALVCPYPEMRQQTDQVLVDAHLAQAIAEDEASSLRAALVVLFAALDCPLDFDHLHASAAEAVGRVSTLLKDLAEARGERDGYRSECLRLRQLLQGERS